MAERSRHSGAAGDGGMTFKDGGTVTLAGSNTYTGKTKVEFGTTVNLASASDIGGGLEIMAPETTSAILGIHPLGGLRFLRNLMWFCQDNSYMRFSALNSHFVRAVISPRVGIPASAAGAT